MLKRRSASFIQVAPAGKLPIKRRQFVRNLKKVTFSAKKELKAIDAAASTAIVLNSATTGSFINSLAAGAEPYQRVGRKVFNSSIDYQFFLEKTVAANATVPEIIRVLLVWTKEPIATAPTFANIIQDVSVGGGLTNLSYSGPNADTLSDYKILYDRTILVGGTTAGTTVQAQPSARDADLHGHKFVPLLGKASVFNAAGIQSGALSVHYQGDVGGQWSAIWKARVKYSEN